MDPISLPQFHRKNIQPAHKWQLKLNKLRDLIKRVWG